MRSLFSVITLVFLLAPGVYGSMSGEIIAIVTEIKGGPSRVEIREGMGRDWRDANPLQSLNDGDEIRVMKGAHVIIVFSKGGQIVKVSEANSPYVVKAQKTASGKSQKMEVAFNKIVDFMAGKKQVEVTTPLAVRATPIPLNVVSPRNSKILTNRPHLEWIGMPKILSTVRLFDGDRKVWEQKRLNKKEVDYPANAPLLREGKKYMIEVETFGEPVVTAWFIIATMDEKKSIEEELSALSESHNYKGATKTLMESMMLIENGFYYDARKMLLAAISKDSSESSLYMMLGRLYEQLGINVLATEAYGEAEYFLIKR